MIYFSYRNLKDTEYHEPKSENDVPPPYIDDLFPATCDRNIVFVVISQR